MKLLIIGAGGYGQVVKELALNTYTTIDFIDDKSDIAIGKVNDLNKFKDYDNVFIAIGNPIVRKDLFEKCESLGFNMITLISDKAYVSPTAIIEPGCIVEPMAVINTNAKICKGSLICAGAIVNHDSVVNEFCQIDCGAVISSRIIIPSGMKVMK